MFCYSSSSQISFVGIIALGRLGRCDRFSFYSFGYISTATVDVGSKEALLARDNGCQRLKVSDLYQGIVMNYLIAVMDDRIKAEAAYSALEEAKFSMQEVDILGRGYKSADEFGLIDPADEAWKQVRRMAVWLVPFGFVAGFTFNAITGLDTFPWAGSLGNQLLGGLLGAGSGGMGAFFIGGGAGAALGSGDALSYRNRLNAGKYLVVVRGSESEVRTATPIIRRFRPENIQGYTAPTVNA
jgi:hypothetical protein